MSVRTAVGGVIAVVVAGMGALLGIGCGPAPAPVAEVVVYCALDLDLSQPIIDAFEKRTGIKVRLVADTEATKTTGLVNRLIAEKDGARADVFWNNEIAQTIRLAEAELLAPYHSPSAADIPAEYKDPAGLWTAFAARGRVLIVHPGRLAEKNLATPASVAQLLDPAFRAEGGIAQPVFGTTLSHALILATHRGDAVMRETFAGLKTNAFAVEAGNGPVAKSVAMGRYAVGLTDTDDVHRLIIAGEPVEMIWPDQGPNDPGAIILPNSIALVKDAPNPEAARQFIDYVLSREVEQLLAHAPGAQIPVRPDVPRPSHVPNLQSGRLKTMPLDYRRLAEHYDRHYQWLRDEF